MPELPEVETVVKGLNKICKNKKILDVWTNYFRYFKYPRNFKIFKKKILNKKILKIERKGKGILFYLSEGFFMFLHQKMTGRFLVLNYKKIEKNKKMLGIELNEKDKKHLHFILFLNKKTALYFVDPRKFAEFYLGKEEIFKKSLIKNIGVDPFSSEFSENFLKEKLLSSQKNISHFLVDQKIIAGIGNIYRSEILWQSKISPFRKTNALKPREVKNLYKSILFVLREASQKGGSSISDFRNIWGEKGKYQNHFLVYRRENEKCFRCGGFIKRIKINGRSIYWCPKCQK